DAPLADEAVRAIDRAKDNDGAVLMSPISAWEIGLLVARGRLALPIGAQAWFDQIIETPNVELADLPPAVLIAASFLPGIPPRDPSDRIVIATAREQNLTIVTRDRQILKYATAGHVRALAC
ncbi:MAG: type II toxin-antitoxin system VapC family toxin, partial [Methyloceanibacter sp.]